MLDIGGGEDVIAQVGGSQVVAAVTVLVGVAAELWRRGLGKVVMLEGLRRLKHLGCTRVFATANEEPADALYHSVMTDMKVTETWIKDSPNRKHP